MSLLTDILGLIMSVSGLDGYKTVKHIAFLHTNKRVNSICIEHRLDLYVVEHLTQHVHIKHIKKVTPSCMQYNDFYVAKNPVGKAKTQSEYTTEQY